MRSAVHSSRMIIRIVLYKDHFDVYVTKTGDITIRIVLNSRDVSRQDRGTYACIGLLSVGQKQIQHKVGPPSSICQISGSSLENKVLDLGNKKVRGSTNIPVAFSQKCHASSDISQNFFRTVLFSPLHMPQQFLRFSIF
jgi:hypothetical protein